MSTEQVSYSPSVGVAKQLATHPLSPLTASEITKSAQLIKGLYPSTASFQFKTITLEEPEKAQLVPYLDAEHSGKRLPILERKALVCYYIRNTVSRPAKKGSHRWMCSFGRLLRSTCRTSSMKP